MLTLLQVAVALLVVVAIADDSRNKKEVAYNPFSSVTGKRNKSH